MENVPKGRLFSRVIRQYFFFSSLTICKQFLNSARKKRPLFLFFARDSLDETSKLYSDSILNMRDI